MKIILPSLGIFGAKSVDMRQPTMEDLRATSSLNYEDALFKVQFVQRLVDNLDLSKITKMDLDYLYAVASFSITFNTVDYKVSCPKCHKICQGAFNFGGKDLVTLDKLTLPYHKSINKKDFTFTLLSAQNHLDAIEYALTQDSYDAAYQDACACFIFGKTLDDIEWVKSLDPSIFLSAFLFQQCLFHGLDTSELVKCSCGHEFTTRVSIPSKLIRVDISDLLTEYSKVSDLLTFDSFSKFTIPEFHAFVEALNNQAR